MATREGKPLNTVQELEILELKLATKLWLCGIFCERQWNRIDSHHNEKIFNVFSCLVGKEHSGSGIGLAIAIKVVDKHKGEISVETEPGKGAVFKFTLASDSGSF